MTSKRAVRKRPEHPAKESRALVLKRVSMVSEKSSQIVIKGDVITLKSRQSRISETIDVLNPGSPGYVSAWEDWFDIDDELKELEEVA